MRRSMTLTVGICTILAGDLVAAQPGSYRQELDAEVKRFVADHLDDWLSYYKQLHAAPELSLHEVQTARRMAERLRHAGYDVATAVGGHGVVGVLRNGSGPVVMIRGDMDALPITEETGLPYASKTVTETADGRHVGVMHACGHDIHQACLAGTAELLVALRQSWRGTVVIVAQPAEEIGEGARMMLEAGLFEHTGKPDYCLALHAAADLPAGSVGYAPGWALANVDSVDITIHGRGGHGSRPHQAVDPIVAAAQTIVALQTIVSRRVDPLESGVITVGSIHGGSKHNIIPDDVRLQLTVRSYTDETRRLLLDGIRDVTVKTCRAMGCKPDPDVVIRENEYTPATYNDPDLADAAAAVFRDALGASNVVQTRPTMGGEDFGRFPAALKVPGLLFWLGTVEAERYRASREEDGDPLPSLHSSRFAPDPIPSIRTGVVAMGSLALSLLDRP